MTDYRHLYSRVSEAYHKLSTETRATGKAVLDLLKVHHRGHKTAVPASELLKGRGISGPIFRRVVAYHRLIGVQIGSSPKGYFWAVTKEDIEITEAHLASRRDALEEDLAGWGMARRTVEMGCSQTSML